MPEEVNDIAGIPLPTALVSAPGYRKRAIQQLKDLGEAVAVASLFVSGGSTAGLVLGAIGGGAGLITAYDTFSDRIVGHNVNFKKAETWMELVAVAGGAVGLAGPAFTVVSKASKAGKIAAHWGSKAHVAGGFVKVFGVGQMAQTVATVPIQMLEEIEQSRDPKLSPAEQDRRYWEAVIRGSKTMVVTALTVRQMWENAPEEASGDDRATARAAAERAATRARADAERAAVKKAAADANAAITEVGNAKLAVEKSAAKRAAEAQAAEANAARARAAAERAAAEEAGDANAAAEKAAAEKAAARKAADAKVAAGKEVGKTEAGAAPVRPLKDITVGEGVTLAEAEAYSKEDHPITAWDNYLMEYWLASKNYGKEPPLPGFIGEKGRLYLWKNKDGSLRTTVEPIPDGLADRVKAAEPKAQEAKPSPAAKQPAPKRRAEGVIVRLLKQHARPAEDIGKPVGVAEAKAILHDDMVWSASRPMSKWPAYVAEYWAMNPENIGKMPPVPGFVGPDGRVVVLVENGPGHTPRTTTEPLPAALEARMRAQAAAKAPAGADPNVTMDGQQTVGGETSKAKTGGGDVVSVGRPKAGIRSLKEINLGGGLSIEEVKAHFGEARTIKNWAAYVLEYWMATEKYGEMPPVPGFLAEMGILVLLEPSGNAVRTTGEAIPAHLKEYAKARADAEAEALSHPIPLDPPMPLANLPRRAPDLGRPVTAAEIQNLNKFEGLISRLQFSPGWLEYVSTYWRETGNRGAVPPVPGFVARDGRIYAARVGKRLLTAPEPVPEWLVTASATTEAGAKAGVRPLAEIRTGDWVSEAELKANLDRVVPFASWREYLKAYWRATGNYGQEPPIPFSTGDGRVVAFVDEKGAPASREPIPQDFAEQARAEAASESGAALEGRPDLKANMKAAAHEASVVSVNAGAGGSALPQTGPGVTGPGMTMDPTGPGPKGPATIDGPPTGEMPAVTDAHPPVPGRQRETGSAAPATPAGKLVGASDVRLADGHPVVELARMGGDFGAHQALAVFGNWEGAIAHLDAGTGPASNLSRPVRADLRAKLVAHRIRLVEHLRGLGAEPLPGASLEGGSDVDLNITGDHAGAKVIEIRGELDNHHPGWRQMYRMALLVDASRVGGAEEHIQHHPDGSAAVHGRLTHQAEMLLMARQLRRLEPHERAARLAQVADPALREQVRALAEQTPRQLQAAHDAALLEGDALQARLKTETNPAEKALLAEALAHKQMVVNSLGEDAYVSAGAVKGYAQGRKLRTPHERYQALIDQLDMIDHQVHEHEGVLGALRRYEIFKYIQRTCDVLEHAGVKDPKTMFFRHLAELYYQADRTAMSRYARTATTPENLTARARGEIDPRTGKPNPRAVAYSDLDVVSPGVDERWLLDQYKGFREMVELHLPGLREHAGSAGKQLHVTIPEVSSADLAGARKPRPPAPIRPEPTTPAEREVGLGAHEAMARAAAAVDNAILAYPAHDNEGRMRDAAQRVLDEVPLVGAARPRLLLVDLHNPGLAGSFNPQTNTLTINTGARSDNGKPLYDLATPEGQQELLNTLYHESRHAEQAFHAMRYALRAHPETGPGSAADALVSRYEVHPDIAAAAAARPFEGAGVGTPEYLLGQKMFNERWGAGRERTHWAQGVVAESAARQNQLDLINAQYEAIPWDKLKSPEAVLLSLEYRDLANELAQGEAAYQALAEEADAHPTGNRAQEFLKLRQALTEHIDRADADLRRAREMEAEVRRSAPHEIAKALARLAAANRVMKDAITASSHLLSKPPGGRGRGG